MRMKEYIYDRSRELLLKMTAVIILSLFLLLTGTRIGIITIIDLVWAICLLVAVTLDFLKKRRIIDTWERTMDGLDKKYLFLECVDKPKKLYEKELFKQMKKAEKSMIEETSDMRRRQTEYKEYIENWVHEIKAPITAAELICDNHPSEYTKRLFLQLNYIEEYVERTLYYARIDNIRNDMIVHVAKLDAIVRESIKKNHTLLIMNRVCVEYESIEDMVYTDEKWLGFLINQFISNAVRYRSENPVITIGTRKIANHKVELSISDNGIGISSQDLPRIFERGFTGGNGRKRGGSTGMGLYICKKVSDVLQMEIALDSKENEYTTVSLCLPEKVNLQK